MSTFHPPKDGQVSAEKNFMNKYQIKYFYNHEWDYHKTPHHDTIMYDTDRESVIEKFESKYPHTTIETINMEDADGSFVVVALILKLN